MKKVSRLPVLLLVIGLLLTMASIIIAQQPAGNRTRPDNQQGRPQFDPAQIEKMRQQRVDQIMEQIKPASDAEGKVIRDGIDGIMKARMDQSQNQEIRGLMTKLREAVDANNSGETASILESIKKNRKDQKAKMDAMENALIEILTPEQEAKLTLAGVVNSDGGGMGGGFFGGPGGPGGGTGGTRQNRGNRTGGQQGQQQN